MPKVTVVAFILTSNKASSNQWPHSQCSLWVGKLRRIAKHRTIILAICGGSLVLLVLSFSGDEGVRRRTKCFPHRSLMGTPEHRFASGSGVDSGSCLLIIHITILLIILAIVSIPGNSNRILNCICSCINVIIRIIIRLQLHYASL